MDTGVVRNRPALIGAAWLRHGLLLVPLLFLLVFFFYPLLAVFAVSLWPDGQLDLSGFARIVTSDYYRETLWFTFWQAAVSTALTLALALPAAYVFVRFRFPGKSLWLALATLPFVLPTIVVASAFSALVGPRGLLNTLLMSLFALPAPPIQLDRTLAIILIVHVFYNVAVALRLIAGFWAHQNPRIEEAARVLGAHGWRLWWYVRLPLLRPAILAAAALVFIFTFTSFGVVVVLGGPRFATLEVEVYRQAVNLFNLPVAAALSLVQIVLMIAMLVVYTRLQKSIRLDFSAAVTVTQPPRTLSERLLVGATLTVMSIFLFLPLAALVMTSITVGETGLTLSYYAGLTSNPRGSVLFVPPIQAIGNSLVFALVTTVLAVGFGLLSAYLLVNERSRLVRWLDPLFMLPLAVSAVTLGFGFLVALDEPPLNLRSSALLIPLAHTLVAMPFVIRSVLPALRSIPPNVREAAQVLGASPAVVWWRVDLPLISRGVLVGAIFAFTVSMGEFGASLFVARPDTPTIPIAIFRLLGQPGAVNYGQALAMSVILLAVSALGFLLIERLRTYGVGEF
ncbi:MAG: iron ABC transporter permease [Anaerolineae bacterium]|nr:iron ABC transporter permease [Anaerolineae bacterium]